MTDLNSEVQLSINKTLQETTEEIQEMADTLYDWNWLDTSGASFSVRIPQKPELFALTPTHSGFRRWKVKQHGLIVLNDKLEMMPSSTSQFRGHPSAIVHQAIYQLFLGVGAVIHTHSPFSLVFACAKKNISPFTLHSQILGDVPCFSSDADTMLDRSVKTVDDKEKVMTSGMEGYEYAFKHFQDLLDQIRNTFKPREQELKRHGLAFTIYKHGIFVMARNLSEAFDNLLRIERNAQVQILSKIVT